MINIGDKIKPKKPNKLPPNAIPTNPSKGWRDIALFMIKGLVIFDSINWANIIITKIIIANLNELVKATITAGAPPIIGPTKGIKSHIATIDPNTKGYSNPAIQKLTPVIIHKIIISIKIQ